MPIPAIAAAAGRLLVSKLILKKDKKPTPQFNAKLGFNVQSNVKAFNRSLTNIQKQQLPFAISLALNETAGDVAQTQKKQASEVFDRPTPFFIRGIAGKKGFKGKRATKRKLVATVIPGYTKSGLGGPGKRVNDAMRLQSEGGTRRPGNKIPIATEHLRVNKYGNLRRNQVKNTLAKANTFSAGRAEGVKPGIYQRDRDGSLKILISYNQSAVYKKKFPFHEIGRGVGRSKFDRNLSKAMKRAIKTRKK